MRKWADRLNYIGDINNKNMVVYKATYHGVKKELYYVGKTEVNLADRWQGHHSHWKSTINILSYIDILAAITEPEDWDIEILGEATTKKDLSKIEKVNIYRLFEDYDLNTVLNLKIPKIPTKYFREIKRKREKWRLKLSWIYYIANMPVPPRPIELIDLSLPEGGAIENYAVPPDSNLFFLFNNYYAINFLNNSLYTIFKVPRDPSRVSFTNLDMRFKMFEARFLRQVRGQEANQRIKIIKDQQNENLTKWWDEFKKNNFVI